MPSRKFSAGSGYRYGFNGKENDKDAGEGIQDYGMRIYDGRLGRFLSVDPLQDDYPELTPYQFASNSPIANIDLDGLERHYYMLVRNGPGGWYKPTLQLMKTVNFTETETKWTPTLTNWGKHTTTTTTNPREEFVVVGQVYVTSGLDGNQVSVENTQWTFSSEASMKAAEKHGGPSNYGGWNWANSDQHLAFALSIGVYNALQADAETPGGVGPGLGSKFSKGSSPSVKVNNTVTSANAGNTAAANSNTASKEPKANTIVKNRNANDAVGNNVLYDINADGSKKGQLLKIGKANGDDLNAAGVPKRMRVSERQAQAAGYPNAKATIRKQLGTTTTKQATDAEATEIKNERANGNTLPLNKEKGKKYKG